LIYILFYVLSRQLKVFYNLVVLPVFLCTCNLFYWWLRWNISCFTSTAATTDVGLQCSTLFRR